VFKGIYSNTPSLLSCRAPASFAIFASFLLSISVKKPYFSALISSLQGANSGSLKSPCALQIERNFLYACPNERISFASCIPLLFYVSCTMSKMLVARSNDLFLKS
jgi:hypothetical protein